MTERVRQTTSSQHQMPSVADYIVHRLAREGVDHCFGVAGDYVFPLRRAILLLSETIDHGSRVKMDEVLRAISDTNTAIYSLGFSSPKSDARHYASEELPTVWSGGTGLSNPNPPASRGLHGETIPRCIRNI